MVAVAVARPAVERESGNLSERIARYTAAIGIEPG